MKKDIAIVDNFDKNSISFNAAEAGKKSDKRLVDFLRLPSMEEYVIEVLEDLFCDL